MKKTLSFLLSVLMVISCFFGLEFNAYADTIASGTYNDSNAEYQFTWSLDSDGTLTLSGNEKRVGNFSQGGAPWYQYRDQVTKLVAEEGIIQLGAYSFYGMTALKEVDFGTVNTIGDHAFQNCTSLEYISLPSQVNWMYTAAFQGCTSLRGAYLGERWWTTGTVPDYFFEGCTSLEVIGMGSNYTGFEANTLLNCSSLKAVITNNTSISSDSYSVVKTDALSGVCSNNTYSSNKLEWHYDIATARLYFTGSGDMIGYDNGSQPWQIFTGAVKKIDFSSTDAKTSVSTTAFQGREALKEVDFTNIYAIGWGAFAECTNLGNLQFDSVLNQIWNYAFANDTRISTIQFKEGAEELHIYAWAFNNCTGTTYWINLPSNTRYIDDHAFWNTNFNYNTINSESVTLGEDAFGNGEGGYARFFGVGGRDTGVYAWVKNARENKNYNWHYYCINDNHTFTLSTVAPTCTETGYDEYGCPYCDSDLNRTKDNFKPALGHQYHCTGSGNLIFRYVCDRCGEKNITVSAFEVSNLFEGALSSTAAETKYNQPDYDGRADINYDGVVNAKDFVLIRDALNSPDLTNKETTIDTSVTYQTLDGFGASAAWWSQYVGTWDNAEDIIKLLYSPTEGIGLNIYRYNLGAGSRDINDTTMYIDDERTNCFLQSDGTYNWDNDAGAMNALRLADRMNSDLRVTLFSNSPPVYMTDNKKAYLTPDTSSNLSSGKYQDYANFITTCAEHFIDEGYNVTAVSPINEPEWGWAGWYNGDGSLSCNQEGCHYEYGDARTFYNNYMVPAITGNAKLNGTVDLEVWESGQMNHSYWWNNFLNYLFSSKNYDKLIAGFIKSGDGYAKANANIRNYVDTVTTHSYWANQAAREAVASQLNGDFFGQKVRCTEYCQMFNDGSSGVYGHILEEGATNGMTIDYGLAMADIIYQDMTIVNATEWDWWTACGKGIYTDSLIYVNATNHDHIETSKRLWCLGNYSKFIDKGAKRISVSTGSDFGKDLVTEKVYTWEETDEDGNTVTRQDKTNYIEESAYLNPDGTVVIVYVNNSDTIEFTTFTNSGYDHFISYVTDKSRDLQQYQSGYTTDAVCIPAKSVTTVILGKGDETATSKNGAYLFTYFTGNLQEEQRIHFAVSEDGYHYTPLNGNKEIITQTKGTLNCRDPYIFLGQDGYYYLIATDMDASSNQWWGNSNTMILWRSKDLTNWTDETVINMSEITGADDIQRCWAPQVLWDEKEQKYFVYFGLASWSVTQNLTVMYYCYTDDLLDQSHYSYPKLLYKPENSSDLKNAIDGDIIYDSVNDMYYLYYKDEDHATICYVKSKNLTGPYQDASNPVNVIQTDIGLEGCNSYFISGTDTMVMLADAYGDGRFVMAQSTDFENFNLVDPAFYTINNCKPRHGSVIAISDEQYHDLINHYGFY